MGEFIAFIVLILVVGAIAAVVDDKKKTERQQGISESLTKKQKLTPTQSLFSADNKTGLILDEDNRKLALITVHPYGDTSKDKTTIIDYRDILSSEIAEDGNSVTKTSRTSQVGGALLGGVLLGGVGAIIGGLSGKKKSHDTVSHVVLRLIINNTKQPAFDVVLMKAESKKTGFIYKTAMEKARHWHGLLEGLMATADREDKEKSATENHASASSIEVQANNTSLADELQKLANLRNEGILTEAEFEIQKQKLLA